MKNLAIIGGFLLMLVPAAAVSVECGEGGEEGQILPSHPGAGLAAQACSSTIASHHRSIAQTT